MALILWLVFYLLDSKKKKEKKIVNVLLFARNEIERSTKEHKTLREILRSLMMFLWLKTTSFDTFDFYHGEIGIVSVRCLILKFYILIVDQKSKIFSQYSGNPA